MYYIAVDVSKKELSVYDGKKDRTFSNTEGLGSLKKYLRRYYRDFNQLIFLLEATVSYSDYLIEMCAQYRIKTVIITTLRPVIILPNLWGSVTRPTRSTPA